MDRTNAERQRRYINRLKARADTPHSPDVVLEALGRLKPVHFPTGLGVAAFAKRVIAEAERIAPGVTNVSREFRQGVTNTPAEGARIAELEKELAQAKAHIQDPEQQDDAEIAALKDEIIALKTTLQAWHHVVKSRESGIMKLSTFNLIRSCVHPDSHKSASEKKLGEAFRVFDRLKCVLCDESEVPTRAFAFTGKEWAWLRGRKARQKRAAKTAKRRPREQGGRKNLVR
jgi:hypothetical protein